MVSSVRPKAPGFRRIVSGAASLSGTDRATRSLGDEEDEMERWTLFAQDPDRYAREVTESGQAGTPHGSGSLASMPRAYPTAPATISTTR